MNIYVSDVTLHIEVLVEIIKKFRKETYVEFSLKKVVSTFAYMKQSCLFSLLVNQLCAMSLHYCQMSLFHTVLLRLISPKERKRKMLVCVFFVVFKYFERKNFL